VIHRRRYQLSSFSHPRCVPTVARTALCAGDRSVVLTGDPDAGVQAGRFA